MTLTLPRITRYPCVSATWVLSMPAGSGTRLRCDARRPVRRPPVLATPVGARPEAGFRNFDPSFWVGLAVPKNTPVDAVRKLNTALNAAIVQTRFKAHAQANGWELVGGPPKVLADTIAQDLAELPALIRRLDIKSS